MLLIENVSASMSYTDTTTTAVTIFVAFAILKPRLPTTTTQIHYLKSKDSSKARPVLAMSYTFLE